MVAACSAVGLHMTLQQPRVVQPGVMLHPGRLCGREILGVDHVAEAPVHRERNAVLVGEALAEQRRGQNSRGHQGPLEKNSCMLGVSQIHNRILPPIFNSISCAGRLQVGVARERTLPQSQGEISFSRDEVLMIPDPPICGGGKIVHGPRVPVNISPPPKS